MTWDHVFPAAWYPTTTPENLEKWKVPSCRPCNNLHGRNESELLLRLGLCVDPDDPKNSGIVEKVLRSLNPSEGRDANDAAARGRERQRILEQAMAGDKAPQDSVLPGFGARSDASLSNQVAVLVSKRSLEMLTEKIVRGITYVEDEKFIEESHEVDFYALTDEGAVELRDALQRFGRLYERAPGITIVRAVAHEDSISSLYEISIWGKLRMFASVSDRARPASEQ